MNSLPVSFQFSDTLQVRVFDENGVSLFVAKDVCTALEIQDTSNAVKPLDDDEKLVRTLYVSGQNRDVLCVNESGLYTLIMRSNKPQARQFRKWVTSEVLPAIRKTGSYNSPQPQIDLQTFVAQQALLITQQQAVLASYEKLAKAQKPVTADQTQQDWITGLAQGEYDKGELFKNFEKKFQTGITPHRFTRMLKANWVSTMRGSNGRQIITLESLKQ